MLFFLIDPARDIMDTGRYLLAVWMPVSREFLQNKQTADRVVLHQGPSQEVHHSQYRKESDHHEAYHHAYLAENISGYAAFAKM